MKKCIGILYAELDTDSRAKRAFAVFDEKYNFTAFVDLCNRPTLFPYPVVQPSLRWRGRLATLDFCIRSLAYLFLKRPDVVYAEGLIPLIPAALYKIFSHSALVYDGREIYIKNQNGESNYNWVRRFTEKAFIHLCDQVLAANSQRAHMVQSHYKLSKPVVAIQNIPPAKNLTNVPLPKDFEYLKMTDKRYIVYQGELANLRGMERLIQSMPHWDRNWDLIFISRGKGAGVAVEMGKKMGLADRIHVHELLDHNSLYEVLKHCHLGLISYEMYGPNNEFCAPNKLFEYAQCGLPSLTSPQLYFSSTFASYKIGCNIQKSHWMTANFQGIAKDVEAALKHPYDKKDFELFNKNYSWENEKLKLRNTLDALTL